jgi:flagellar hook-associated protein 3 FlgL
VLTRAIAIGTEGANGTLSASDRQAIAGEVQGLQSQLVGLGNTAYQGTFLFSGTAVTTQPFTLDTTTNAVTYNGNTGVSSVQLSNGNSINTNVPGSQLFLNGAGSAFDALQNLNSALLSGNSIGAAVSQLGTALSQISTQRVFYGNALNQVNFSENFLNQDKVNLSTQENALVGADPAKAASDLVQAQTANQATLSATGRILSLPTLLDFLK